MLGRLARLAFALGICAVPQDVVRLYPQPDLEQAARTYRHNLEGLWNEDFLSRLTSEERARTGPVALNLPLVGANRYPLDFYADAARKKVYLPIASVKFVDDMAIAVAYYDRIHCDIGVIADYAAALR